MLTPDDITDDTFHKVANELLQEQMQYSCTYIHDEISRWDESFVSDDGTDYVQTALDALQTLMRIRYEGNAEMLRRFLFTSRTEAEKAWEDPDNAEAHKLDIFGAPAHAIDSAEGLCPTIMAIIEPMYNDEGNS
jgi:hypothetical protein